jgi:hypothetical protein
MPLKRRTTRHHVSEDSNPLQILCSFMWNLTEMPSFHVGVYYLQSKFS